jgi:predicted ATPase
MGARGGQEDPRLSSRATRSFLFSSGRVITLPAIAGAPARSRKSERSLFLFVELVHPLPAPSFSRRLLFHTFTQGGLWTASFVAFNGDMVRELAAQFLTLADKQQTIPPRLVAHRLMGSSFLFTGDSKEAVAHYGRVIALYDPAENRQHATRFSIDARVAALSFRAWALWLLGYPDAAFADAERGLKDAREIGHAASLMHTLANTPPTLIQCGSYEAASELLNERGLLANEKGASLWKAIAATLRGRILALTGGASDAVQMITSGLTAVRATGATLWEPENLSYLAGAYAKCGRIDEATRCIGEALTVTETSKEKWSEAESNRVAGEIALTSPPPNSAEAERYFERALSVARQQQAKSWNCAQR